MHPANAQQVEGVRCGGQGEGVIGNRQIQGNVNLRLRKPLLDFVPFLRGAGMPSDAFVVAGPTLDSQPRLFAPRFDRQGAGAEHSPRGQCGGDPHGFGHLPGQPAEWPAVQAVEVKPVGLHLFYKALPSGSGPCILGQILDGSIVERCPAPCGHGEVLNIPEVAVAAHNPEVDFIAQGGHEVGDAPDGSSRTVGRQVPINGHEDDWALPFNRGHGGQSIGPTTPRSTPETR